MDVGVAVASAEPNELYDGNTMQRAEQKSGPRCKSMAQRTHCPTATGWLHLADEILPAYQYSSVGANDGSLQEAHPENHDLEMDDLVTVEGLEKNGIIEATKITIHRDWLKCREIKGEKPAHCKC